MVFHHWESNFTPREKWFYTLLPTKQCKTENEGKQFFGKTFYALPNGAYMLYEGLFSPTYIQFSLIQFNFGQYFYSHILLFSSIQFKCFMPKKAGPDTLLQSLDLFCFIQPKIIKSWYICDKIWDKVGRWKMIIIQSYILCLKVRRNPLTCSRTCPTQKSIQ